MSEEKSGDGGRWSYTSVNCQWPFDSVRIPGLLLDGIGVNEAGQTNGSPGVPITRLHQRREVRQIFDPSLWCTSVRFRRLDPLADRRRRGLKLPRQ